MPPLRAPPSWVEALRQEACQVAPPAAPKCFSPVGFQAHCQKGEGKLIVQWGTEATTACPQAMSLRLCRAVSPSGTTRSPLAQRACAAQSLDVVFECFAQRFPEFAPELPAKRVPAVFSQSDPPLHASPSHSPSSSSMLLAKGCATQSHTSSPSAQPCTFPSFLPRASVGSFSTVCVAQIANSLRHGGRKNCSLALLSLQCCCQHKDAMTPMKMKTE